MIINELFNKSYSKKAHLSSNDLDVLFLLSKNCSDYIKNHNIIPLYKKLKISENRQECRKVKLRYNHMHNSPQYQILETILTKQELGGQLSVKTSTEGFELKENESLFYVFPINGYKIFYSNIFTDFENKGTDIHEQILKQTNKESTIKMVSKLLEIDKQANKTLIDKVNLEHEILIYNTSYFYAIECSQFDFKSINLIR